METENVYYRLWESPIFLKARTSGLPDIFNDSVTKECCFTRDNNMAFLKELDRRKVDGYQSVMEWLDNLLTDYVERSHGNIIHVGCAPDTDFHCYSDWLDNTRFICDNSFVVRFCNEIEQMIRDFSKDGNSFAYNDNEVRAFKDKVGRFLGKAETESLLKRLPTLKPKELKLFYQEHSKLQQRFSLKDFFNLCESVVHRDGEKGWNYQNIKK